jgi:hypothetical protein
VYISNPITFQCRTMHRYILVHTQMGISSTSMDAGPFNSLFFSLSALFDFSPPAKNKRLTTLALMHVATGGAQHCFIGISASSLVFGHPFIFLLEVSIYYINMICRKVTVLFQVKHTVRHNIIYSIFYPSSHHPSSLS